jgi:hypothetical protein
VRPYVFSDLSATAFLYKVNKTFLVVILRPAGEGTALLLRGSENDVLSSNVASGQCVPTYFQTEIDSVFTFNGRPMLNSHKYQGTTSVVPKSFINIGLSAPAAASS